MVTFDHRSGGKIVSSLATHGTVEFIKPLFHKFEFHDCDLNYHNSGLPVCNLELFRITLAMGMGS